MLLVCVQELSSEAKAKVSTCYKERKALSEMLG